MNPGILAQVYPSDVIGAGRQYLGTTGVHQMLIFAGALLAVSTVAVLMALIYFKKRKRRRHRHHHHNHDDHPPVEKQAAVVKSTRRRKRSHRSKLPMNPTLAQTGGLPPVRDDDTPWLPKY